MMPNSGRQLEPASTGITRDDGTTDATLFMQLARDKLLSNARRHQRLYAD